MFHSITSVARWRWPVAGLSAGLLVVSASALAEDVSALAQRLSALRADVERLSSELADKQNDQRERSRSLSRQKADLELEKSREELRLTKLSASIADKKKETEQRQAESDQYGPLFDDKLKSVRAYVERSLPFRRAERLASLEKLEDQRRSGLIVPERAVSRLWSFIEDELRLTRESGLYKQTVKLADGEQMVDVVRIGMVALYYRTADDAVGHTARKADQWSFVEVDNSEEKTRVLELFDQFKKQIRVGYFELPNALPMEE